MAKKKWILLVDDDPTILFLLTEALAHPELSITTASDSTQSFIQARTINPILIISDIQMPGPGGYGPETYKQLRADPRIPRVPIIFMTGMALDKARLLLPANDPTIGLIAKPFDIEKVRQYVFKLAGVVAPDTKANP